MKNKYILSIIAITLFAILSYNFLIKNATQKDTVRLGLATWAGFGSGFVGEEINSFENLNLNQVILDDVTARHAAFQSGQIDVMISSIDVFAQELASGIEGKIILITDESSGGDGILTHKSIKNLADLKGKKIAFARATPSHYFLYKILKDVGLSMSDIVAVTFDDPVQASQAYASGSVDAAVTFEPFLSQIANDYEGTVLATTRDYPDIIIDVLVASKDFLKETEKVKKFVAGWVSSSEQLINDPDHLASVIASGFKMNSVEDVKGMMSGLKYAGEKRNRELLCSSSENLVQAEIILNEAISFWKSEKVIDDIPETSESIATVLCDIIK